MAQQNLPHTLYTCEQTRKLDQLAIEEASIPGIVLMKRAGRFAFDTLRQGWPGTQAITIICGAGNNAGDGYVVAALAAQKAINTRVLYLHPPENLKGDAHTAWVYASQENVSIEAYSPETFKAACRKGGIIVDAIFGSGLSRQVEGEYADAIDAINESGLPVLALDIPSGLDGDTGKVLGCAVKAKTTCCFIGLKRGLLTGRAPALVGELKYSALEVPPACFAEVQATCQRTSSFALTSHLPKREADAHKGKFGHVMVVGGDIGMGGAALLAGEASAHSGAGLTSIATQPDHVAGILARCPELMVTGVPSGQALEPLLSKPDVIVLGPGLGRASWSEQMLQQTTLTTLPLVMDADALNLLAEGRVVRDKQRDNWVLTPHPGEAARLLACSVKEVQDDRFHAAWEIQKRYGGVVVLKGAGTLIVSNQGCMLANVGNPGMATGGMGDILSGVIGALIAQGMPLHTAAALAVCVHGDAADCCADKIGTRGLLASELLPYLRHLLN